MEKAKGLFMDNKYVLLKGTLLLTGAGFITKIIGFIYRIFLSQTIGAEGMGIYQLIFPIHTLCFALSVGGSRPRSPGLLLPGRL